jgi:hypothetical protein
MSTETHDRSTLETIAPMREAGFALHWLHPRKKRPIGDRWQDQPVATLDDLRRSHRPGNNLGVRLGEISATPAGYLHVFDLDIRMVDQADDAWAAFEAMFPGLRETLPCVASGSGGESRHLYFVTDKPFRGKKLAVSEGKHRRKTVDDDGKEKETWSYDWEIELFGTGKQVAMPPSIHPDTGKPYTWEREFEFSLLDLGMGPEIPSSVIEALGVAETATYDYETRDPLTFKPGQMERDLDAISISDLDYDDWVRLGQALHHQFGGSQEGFDIWLKHTKRSSKFTGDKQIREMRRIKWRSFGKYRGQPVTMATVRVWAQEARAAALTDMFDDIDDDDLDDDDDIAAGDADDEDLFDDVLGGAAEAPAKPDKPKERDPLSDDPGSTKGDVLGEDDDTWKQLLDYNEEGAIKPTLHNLRLIVENDVWTRGVPAYNEFTQEIVQRGVPGVKPGKTRKSAKKMLQLSGTSWAMRDRVNGDFWTDDKDNAIRALIEAPKTQGGHGVKVPDRDLRAAVDIVARKNGFHPVREFLTGLEWDGQKRIETLFIDYVGAPDDSYHRAVGRLMTVAAVTRVFEPGHKFDTATILEGLQGKRKSTFISTLAKSWFTELDGDFEDAKQMVELMAGSWLLEIPELSGFQKADVRHIKAFISRTTDKVRLAYARRAQEYPRQCIFIGSTNDDTYLKDETGGRRYWPVRCSVDEIDTDRLAGEVDQIWAEAVVVYREMRATKPRGTLPLYLVDADARVIAERLQESRRVESSDDALAGQIAEWLSKPISDGGFDDEDENGQPRFREQVCLLQIWCECLGRDASGYIGAWPSTLGRSMKQIPGWSMTGGRDRFGKYGQQRAYARDR